MKHGLMNSCDITDFNNSEHQDYGSLGCDAVLFLEEMEPPMSASW
jgi:hypothetical protein